MAVNAVTSTLLAAARKVTSSYNSTVRIRILGAEAGASAAFKSLVANLIAGTATITERGLQEFSGIGAVEALKLLPAAPWLTDPLQVPAVATSACLFGLPGVCADVQDSAVALSLTIALVIARQCGFRAFAPAATQDTCFRKASIRRTGISSRSTLLHNSFNA